ncbi:MAG: porin family protein, partial [Flavobacteriaceae bacterium]
MRFLIFGFLFFVSGWAWAQIPDEYELTPYPDKAAQDSVNMRKISLEPKSKDTLIKSNDLFYREDQFYVAVTYNLLQKRTGGISQNTFSSGFHLGFLRDFPVNKDRNVAVALGFGYSINNFRTNLHIADSDPVKYQIAENFEKNRLNLHYIDIPFEIRWRTSTPKNTQFWRIYTGFKLSWLVYSRSKINGDFPSEEVKNNSDLNNLRYGMYLS